MSEGLFAQLERLNAQELRRILVDHLTKQKLGLYWEANAIERDAALNADLVLPRLVKEWSHTPAVRLSKGEWLEAVRQAHRERSPSLPTATSSSKATTSIRCVYSAPPTPEKSASSTST